MSEGQIENQVSIQTQYCDRCEMPLIPGRPHLVDRQCLEEIKRYSAFLTGQIQALKSRVTMLRATAKLAWHLVSSYQARCVLVLPDDLNKVPEEAGLKFDQQEDGRIVVSATLASRQGAA